MHGRNLEQVVKAMVLTLRVNSGQSTPDAQGKPVDLDKFIARLQQIAFNEFFTAPENLGTRWQELVVLYNRVVFGTDVEQEWVRERAPAWAQRAGRILAADEGHEVIAAIIKDGVPVLRPVGFERKP